MTRAVAGLVIPFVAVMGGFARGRDAHEDITDSPVPAHHLRLDELTITNPVEDIPCWSDEIGAKVSWTETIDGIEMGIEKLLDAVERGRALQTLQKALNRWKTGSGAKVSLIETFDGINIKIVNGYKIVK